MIIITIQICLSLCIYNLSLSLYIYIYTRSNSPPKAGFGGPQGPRGPRQGPQGRGTGRGEPGTGGPGPLSTPSPGGPRAQYIRSGPEGARGVLKGRGWSLCMLLSALSSALSSPNSCGFPSEALCVLLTCMCLWEPGGVRAFRGISGGTPKNHYFFRIDF